MTNPNPVRKSDYRDIKDPKLPSRKVLIWMIDNDSAFEYYTSRDLTEQFGCIISVSATKLYHLRRWGCIRIDKRGRGNQPHQYIITEWGRKMAAKWRKEE
jgi:hypothetical protein